MFRLSTKFIVMFLILGLNYSGLFAVGEVLAYYFDIEGTEGNAMTAASLDFSLIDSGWTPVESEVSLEYGNSVFKDVDIQNDGILDFQYTARTDNVSGDTGFCDSLNLKAELLGEEMYNDSLSAFAASATSSIDGWSYRVDMLQNYQNSICHFDFLYDGWQLNMPAYGSGGFSDTEKIENTIASWGLRINKVYYDAAPDRGVEGNNEWIEIYNQTNVPLDVSGWEICDNNSCDTIPASSPIPAEGFAVLTPESTTWAYWTIPSEVVKIVLGSKIGNGLSDEADMLILKRPDGVIVDQMNWGTPSDSWDNYNEEVWNPGAVDVAEGNMLARNPNGHDTNQASDFVEFGPPDLDLIYPDQSGGLMWYWTYTYDIQWTAFNPNGDDNDISIDLYYIKDINQDGVISAGDTMHTIVKNTANDGTHAWRVPKGFLGYIWIKVVAKGPENPMLNSAMISAKIFDPFPMEMWGSDPALVMQAMYEAGMMDMMDEEADADPDEEVEIIGEEFIVTESEQPLADEGGDEIVEEEVGEETIEEITEEESVIEETPLEEMVSEESATEEILEEELPAEEIIEEADTVDSETTDEETGEELVTENEEELQESEEEITDAADEVSEEVTEEVTNDDEEVVADQEEIVEEPAAEVMEDAVTEEAPVEDEPVVENDDQPAIEQEAVVVPEVEVVEEDDTNNQDV